MPQNIFSFVQTLARLITSFLLYKDLITFSEDESCLAAVESTFPASVCKEELAKGTKAPANNSWNTGMYKIN